MNKLETNEDLFIDLLNYSPYGGLCQAFIKVALEEYCKQILSAKEEWPDNSFINQETWKGIALDIQERMTKFYRFSREDDDGPSYE